MTQVEFSSDFDLTQHIMGELWGFYCEYVRTKWPYDTDMSLYCIEWSNACGKMPDVCWYV